MIARTCSVVLPIPSSTPYTYAIPVALADRVVPGARVVVPVRSRELVGVVLDVTGEAPDESLKSVLLAPDPAPLVAPSLLELAGWLSRYYVAPMGLALRTMLPAALWGASRLVAVMEDQDAAAGGTSRLVLEALARAGGRAGASQLGRRLKRPVWDVLQRLAGVGAVSLETEAPDLGPTPHVERVIVLTKFLPTLIERQQAFGRAQRQREAYEAADGLGGEVPVRLLTQLGFSGSVVQGLVKREVATILERERPRDPFDDLPEAPSPPPTEAQKAAIAAVRELPPGRALCLLGVTGSGKTLVYLEAFREDVRHQRGVIVLVPEIALTPQTVARVRGAFGNTVAVLHSGLSDGERVDAWRALAAGEKLVAVGARSAVFAPVRNLAAIIVDEEHDGSYKQHELPRYHARDVALRRARIEGARVVLGSATPALETWYARDRIPVVGLPVRIGERPLPPVDLIDMRSAPRVREARSVPWARALDEAVDDTLAAGDQVMLLLNRRGFAHFLQCRGCGRVWECPSCSISLTVHRSPDGLRCHYCGYDEPIPARCPDCGADAHRSRGVGTQSLERWLAERYPLARLARMDADTTVGKWSHRRILDAVGKREVDVLLGTQMISKGLDFPGVTLLGVVDADTGLHLPDLRAAERTFQLIAQVAGRAGRGPHGGRVLVQTHTPDHDALRFASQHDFEGFAARELSARESPAYPPHVGLANAVISGTDQARVAEAATDVHGWFRGLLRSRALEQVELIGPAPAPLARIKRRWRWHLLLRSADRPLLGRILWYASCRAPHTRRGPVRVVFDRDPVSLL